MSSFRYLEIRCSGEMKVTEIQAQGKCRWGWTIAAITRWIVDPKLWEDRIGKTESQGHEREDWRIFRGRLHFKEIQGHLEEKMAHVPILNETKIMKFGLSKNRCWCPTISTIRKYHICYLIDPILMVSALFFCPMVNFCGLHVCQIDIFDNEGDIEICLFFVNLPLY
jgi:hypothetical protein